MPGKSTYLTLYSREIIIFNHTYPIEVTLEVFSHGDQTKVHYKKEDGKIERTLIPLPYDTVHQILAKRRTDLIPK